MATQKNAWQSSLPAFNSSITIKHFCWLPNVLFPSICAKLSNFVRCHQNKEEDVTLLVLKIHTQHGCQGSRRFFLICPGCHLAHITGLYPTDFLFARSVALHRQFDPRLQAVQPPQLEHILSTQATWHFSCVWVWLYEALLIFPFPVRLAKVSLQQDFCGWNSLKNFEWSAPVTIHLGVRTDGKKNSVDSVWVLNHRNQTIVDAYGQCTVALKFWSSLFKMASAVLVVRQCNGITRLWSFLDVLYGDKQQPKSYKAQ